MKKLTLFSIFLAAVVIILGQLYAFDRRGARMPRLAWMLR